MGWLPASFGPYVLTDTRTITAEAGSIPAGDCLAASLSDPRGIGIFLRRQRFDRVASDRSTRAHPGGGGTRYYADARSRQGATKAIGCRAASDPGPGRGHRFLRAAGATATEATSRRRFV